MKTKLARLLAAGYHVKFCHRYGSQDLCIEVIQGYGDRGVVVERVYHKSGSRSLSMAFDRLIAKLEAAKGK